MNLDEAVYREITGGRSPATQGGTTASIVRELARKHGAKAPEGVSDRTWRRARHDPAWKPSPRIRDALEAAQRRARLSAGRERRLRTPVAVGINARVQVSSEPPRMRKIRIDKFPGWNQGDAHDMVDRFLAGETSGLGDAIEEVIRSGASAKDVDITDVKSVHLFSDDATARAWYRSRDMD